MSVSEEMVTWVDNSGKVLGPVSKDLANSDPKYLHLEVAVMIVDKRRRVLLQKRALSKKVAPGIWTIAAAGHITFGDSPLITAHRELKEEMGIEVPQLIPLFEEIVRLPNERHIAYWYIGEYVGGEIKIQVSEVAEFTWLEEGQLSSFVKGKDVSERTLSMIKRYWAHVWDDKLHN